MTDDIGERFSVFIAAQDIVPKRLLNVTLDVLIFSYKVVKSISDNGSEDFRHNKLQRYWMKISEVAVGAFFVRENGDSLFPDFGEFSSDPRR